MIQELFEGNASALLNRNRNLPISAPPSPSSSTTTAAAAAATAPTTTSDNQKLRCPRCDSSHTKFCYYNNYNLTQPRHFCKTCRRYWTKGGALRNVPIGGGCRKNKPTTITTAVGKPISATGRLKSAVSSELGKSSFMHGFELESSNPNPIIWSGPPQTSHLLSLFRATQNPNPSFTSNPITHMKDQNFMAGSNMGSLGFEPLCSSLWRNNQQDHENHHEQRIMSTGNEGVQNTRIRSSSSSSSSSLSLANCYHHHHDQTAPLILSSSVANITSSSSTILDSAPVLTIGDLGFWNQTLPWSDLAATNGAYP